eukprot:s2022_g12.t1
MGNAGFCPSAVLSRGYGGTSACCLHQECVVLSSSEAKLRFLSCQGQNYFGAYGYAFMTRASFPHYWNCRGRVKSREKWISERIFQEDALRSWPVRSRSRASATSAACMR